MQLAEIIEQMQLEAARIVTGLTRSASHVNLYKECCWEPLNNRRERQKVCFMYKVDNQNVPEYILDLFPPTVQERTNYELRNRNDIKLIHTVEQEH